MKPAACMPSAPPPAARAPSDDIVNGMRRSLLALIAAYLRHTPDHPGRWRLAQLAVDWSPLLKTLPRPRTITLREGFKLLVDGRSQTGRIAYVTGGYEPRATAIIKALVSAGDTVIDVGANIGYFSLLAARVTGSSGRVLAFEPNPPVREELLANLRLNGFAHVSVHSEALSASTDDVSFYLGPSQDTGLASLRAMPDSRELKVHQVRFDDLWKEPRPVTFVKIDVEGAELRVLEGMKDTLRRDRPAIILEVTDEYLKVMGDSAESLYNFLRTIGYHVYEIRDDGPLGVIKTAADLKACPGQFNALCAMQEGLELSL